MLNNKVSIVESSEAPMLTPEYIAENDKATETVEIEFNDDVFSVEVKRGVPVAVDIRRMEMYKKVPYNKDMDEDVKEKALEERSLYIRRLLVSEMIVSIPFSFEGRGEGNPVEHISESLLQTLYNAHLVVNDPNSIVYKQARMTESDEEDTEDAPDETPTNDLVETPEDNDTKE